VRGDCDQPGRGERPEHAEREDRHRGNAEAPPADVQTAVEEDDDERHDADALDRDDRDRVVQPWCEVRGGRGGEQEERGARNRQPFGDRAAEERQREARRDHEDDLPEVGDLRQRMPATTG
jgi:hypothetical protein